MTYQWFSFTVIDENEIRTDSNFSRGDSFVYEGADATMYVYDNDWGLAGDSGGRNNETGSDWQPGWLNEDGEWVNAGNVYWEGYFVLHGSDGQTYYMIEIEATNLPDGGNDHFAFYGKVPPQGVELTAVCYYHDCGSLSYACLDGGEIGSHAVPPAADDDFLAVMQGEGFGDMDINVLVNDSSNTAEALIVKELDGSASAVGVWVDLPEGGRILVSADGTVDFDADGDFDALGAGETATLSVDYTVLNSDGLTDTATLTIEVTGINDAPVAVDQCERITEDEVATGNLMDGAFDIDGDVVTLDSISIGAIGEEIAVTTANGYTGTVVVNADGTFTYTPGPDAQDMNDGDADSFTFEFTVKSPNGTKTIDNTRTIDFETGEIVVTYADGRGNPGNDKEVGSVGEDPNGTGEAENGGTVGNSDGFSTDPETTSGGGDLYAGDVITSQIAGMTISVNAYGKAGKYDEAMIFDTNNPTGGDTDLATDTQNNVLIISEDGISSNPDDNAKGGEITFSFDEPTDVKSLTLIDNEEGAWIVFLDENGCKIGDKYVAGGVDGGIQVVPLDGVDVSKMIVALCGSGAIDDLIIGSTEEVPDYLYDTATATIKIDGLSDNLPPSVTAQVAETDENTAVSGNLLDGATDPDGDTVTLQSIDIGAIGEEITVTTDGGRTGTLVVNADGTFTFTPDGVDLDLNETDTISFGFTGTDGEFTDSATATITITGLNDAPVAQAQVVSTNEANDQGLAASVSGNLLDGATDADGDAISLQSTSLGAIGETVAVTTDGGRSGELTINADGTFTFTSTDDSLDLNQADTLSFEFTVASSGGVTVQTDTATATININGVNVAPVTIDSSYEIAEANDQGLTNTVSGNLLDGASDADGDAISIFSTTIGAVGETVVVQTANGVDAELTIQADGSFTLTALDTTMDLNETDLVEIGFTAVSSGGVTNQFSDSVATITINGVNVGPVAQDQAYETSEDASVNANILTGASDADGDAVVLDSISDGLQITTNPRAVVANQVTTANGLTGTLIVYSDGRLAYTPSADAAEAMNTGDIDTFTFEYTVESTGGVTPQQDTRTVTITIIGEDDNTAPVVTTEYTTTVGEDDTTSGNLTDVFTDPDGDTITVTQIGDEIVDGETTVTVTSDNNGWTGTVTVNPDGGFTFDPGTDFETQNDGESETVTFEYTVTDGNGGTTTNTATITVTGEDEVVTPPPATADVNYYFLIDTSASMFVEQGAVTCDYNGDGSGTYVDLSIGIAEGVASDADLYWGAFAPDTTVDYNFFTFGSIAREVDSAASITSQSATPGDLTGALNSLKANLNADADNRVFIFTGASSADANSGDAVADLVANFNAQVEAYEVGSAPVLTDMLTGVLPAQDVNFVDECLDVETEQMEEANELFDELILLS
ncbi:beta strand repeat-containing protein [Roseobacter sp. HKCCA0434]|uniref:beta strand repeat-containing protein n=1 Tax=Roseobacter sp. HKCCA0434 TaxID=3079297 RepID=UPI0029058CEB|nr:Ig-like domain-containing protein [Roseobacter sp. HKCCA0434]